MSLEPEYLAAISSADDDFALFDLPRGFDVDTSALRRRFFDLNRQIHPDARSGATEEEQAAGMLAAARLNEAYETLRDPIRRAEYLLLSSGGKTAAQDKRVPQEILNQSLMLREEIDEARASGDTATLAAIRQNISQQLQAADARIADLARRVCSSATDADRDALRLELNSLKYLSNLLAQF